jgi:hypothetical protein
MKAMQRQLGQDMQKLRLSVSWAGFRKPTPMRQKVSLRQGVKVKSSRGGSGLRWIAI